MKKIALTLALLVAGITSAQAQSNTPFTLAASLGSSQLGVGSFCDETTSCTKNPTGFALIGAWDLGSGLSAEVSYRSFGSFNAQRSLSMDGLALQAGSKLEAQNFGISGAYTLPLGAGLSLKGRVGLGQTSSKVNVTGSVGGTMLVSEGSTTKQVAPLAGLELSYALSKELALTLSFDHTKGQVKFDGETDKFNLNQYSLGARFSF